MFTKFYRTVSAFSLGALLTTLLAVAPVAGQGTQPTVNPTPGTNQAQAGAPLSGPITLEPKTSHWYKFTYHYDNSDPDNEPSKMEVKLKMDVTGCVAFQVQTQRLLDHPYDKDGEPLGPVGNGTPQVKHDPNDDAANGDGNFVYPAWLIWAGGQRASDHFYVIVSNRTPNSTCHYTLSIQGADVSF